MAGRFDVSLSNHKLSLLAGDEGCLRCFYDHCQLKVERPRGIFPSLSSGMDDRLKVYFDRFRGSLPPALRGRLPGVLWGDTAQIKKVRHWNSNTKPIVPTPYGVAGLIHAFDDLVQRDDGFVSILDGKTRGNKPEPGYAERYYQTQADLYHVHMKLGGMHAHPEAFFVFVTPLDCDPDYTLPDCLPIPFDVTVQRVLGHFDDGMELITQGMKILSGGRPAGNPNCPWCQWEQKRYDLGLTIAPADVAAPVAGA